MENIRQTLETLCSLFKLGTLKGWRAEPMEGPKEYTVVKFTTTGKKNEQTYYFKN